MNKQIIEEAAEWLVEFSTCDADAQMKRRFDTWMRRSPEHVRVYLELLPLWEDGAHPLSGEAGDPEALAAWARAQDSVVPLDGLRAIEPENAHRRRHRWAIAASIAVGILTAGSVLWFEFFRPPTYVAGVGEKRSITLEDGSAIELNTRSRVRVDFNERRRTVHLLEGQAMFRVAKDAGRPFVVSVDGTRVQAVGTQFDVYRRDTGTTVTVLDGRVAVGRVRRTPAPDDAKPVLLSAGEQLTVTAAKLRTPHRANVASAVAWTQGRLIFDSTSLTEVADEFNRYNARRIAIDDPTLKDFRVSASFGSSNPTALLRFLRDQPGLVVQETPLQIRIARAADSNPEK